MSCEEIIHKEPIDSVSVNSYNKGVTTPNNFAANIQIVSAELIDNDMCDKLVSSKPVEKLEKQEKPVEEPGFWSRVKNVAKQVLNSMEQGAKSAVISIAGVTKSDTLMDLANSFEELDDDNAEKLGNIDATSKNEKHQKLAAKVTAKIKDIKRQLEVVQRHITVGKKAVQQGYAENYHKFSPENQAPAAEIIMEHAVDEEVAQTCSENIANCDIEQQSNVVKCAARGVSANRNFSDDQKTLVGCNVVENISKLDKSQQADAYAAAANELHQYQTVVEKVAYEVANKACDQVREQAMEKLKNSEYENVKETFTYSNIRRLQAEYRKSQGAATKEDEKILKEYEKATGNKVAQSVLRQELSAKDSRNKAEAEQKSENDKTGKTISNDSKATGFGGVTLVSSVSNKQTSSDKLIQNFPPSLKKLAEKYDIENCRTVDEFAEIVKDLSKTDVKTLFENITPTKTVNMFRTTSSAYLQALLLHEGYVKYDDVKNYCMPDINTVIEVFSKNHNIDFAIQKVQV